MPGSDEWALGSTSPPEAGRATMGTHWALLGAPTTWHTGLAHTADGPSRPPMAGAAEES